MKIKPTKNLPLKYIFLGMFTFPDFPDIQPEFPDNSLIFQ